MKVYAFRGSRADAGLIDPVAARMQGEFDLVGSMGDADLVLLAGDRHEVLRCALEAHLLRIPIAHIAGGDVTEGSYDDAMRDCISRMASIHFVTSTSAMARLTHMGMHNVHLVGYPGIDVVKRGDWKAERPYPVPYVVVSYQSETLDPRDDAANFQACRKRARGRLAVYVRPNADAGSLSIDRWINDISEPREIIEGVPHGAFLNLLHHCEEFIGNSSAMLYEAPEMGVRTFMVGRRQKGRTIPWGDGLASERIVKILRYAA